MRTKLVGLASQLNKIAQAHSPLGFKSLPLECEVYPYPILSYLLLLPELAVNESS